MVCIFGLCGACRSHELPDVLLKHIKKYDDMYLVTIPLTKNYEERSFAVTGTFFSIFEKYAALRPSAAKCDRFFLNYQKGKCTVQPIGKNKFYKMAGRYTGNT